MIHTTIEYTTKTVDVLFMWPWFIDLFGCCSKRVDLLFMLYGVLLFIFIDGISTVKTIITLKFENTSDLFYIYLHCKLERFFPYIPNLRYVHSLFAFYMYTHAYIYSFSSIPFIKLLFCISVQKMLWTFSVTEASDCDWTESMRMAVEQLDLLGAVERKDDHVSLTPLGKKMASFPLEPRFAKVRKKETISSCVFCRFHFWDTSWTWFNSSAKALGWTWRGCSTKQDFSFSSGSIIV